MIGVTGFFRDPKAFEAVEEQIIPALFAGRTTGSLVRIWSAGCSTGEEPYSIAMLLQEGMDALKQMFTVQIFATDIDRQAIATARAGVYPPGIAADLSPERLSRHFTPEPGGGYRVRKGLRDMMVFSEHDVIKDPPFSRLDLLSCRNVLIYMDADLQKKLLPVFHYALAPGGFLVLGTSEGVGPFDDLFGVTDRSQKLFRRKADPPHGARTTWGRSLEAYPPTDGSRQAARKTAGGARPSPRELTEAALLQQVAPSGALVNERGDVLYLHGRTGVYLEPVPGEPGVSNLVKMAREGLQRDLAITLRKAVATNETARCVGLRVKTNTQVMRVDVTVWPLARRTPTEPDPRLYLVTLVEGQSVGKGLAGAEAIEPGDNETIAALEAKLRTQEEYLQTTSEELVTTNEELQSSNEEMQSVNEELQSTNEELETSKEELQSINEELATVNAELQASVADLTRANNDMNNLLAGTGVATVFVDHNLRILRFTPTAADIIHLIPGDLGRPVSHLASNLKGYDRLVEDARSVLGSLIPIEVNVESMEGTWLTLRIIPYRTLANVIEGAVITFVDITETVRAREALRKSNDQLRLAVVVRDARDAITVQDLEGRILAWNPAATRMYGWSEAEALLLNVRDRIPEELREMANATLAQLVQGEFLEPYHTRRITRDGRIINVSVISTALVDEGEQVYAIATTERVIDGGAL